MAYWLIINCLKKKKTPLPPIVNTTCDEKIQVCDSSSLENYLGIIAILNLHIDQHCVCCSILKKKETKLEH